MLCWQVIRVPVQGRIDDRLEIMSGSPADCPPRQRIIGDQGRRVAFAAWPVFDFKISTHDVLNGRKQFLHGCAMAGAKIEGVAAAVIQEMLDRTGMRIGKVENVNEIAHARPIPGVIVRAQNLKMRTATQSRIECNRYGVSFRRMPFANSSLGVCSGRVEIAQDNRPKALVEVQILQYLLDDQLASTVWIDWRLGVSLIHRD